MKAMRVIALVTLTHFLTTGVGLAALAPRTLPSGAPSVVPALAPPAPATVPAAYGRLPLAFEENRGQAGAAAKFVARGPGYTALVTGDGLVLALRRPGAGGPREAGRRGVRATRTVPRPVAHDLLRMSLVGAGPAPLVEGLTPLPGTVNYLIGRDPSRWRTEIPTYARVGARDVYPGIDVVYYGNPRQLEYDFVVAPGADPGAIRLAFEGAERIWTDVRGDLVLVLGGGELRLAKPVVYQTIGGARRLVDSAYRVTARGERTEIAFSLGAWDRSRPVVIDPTLVYSTLLGGSDLDLVAAVAVDSHGSAYLAGSTLSVDFPTTPGSVQPTWPGGDSEHAFVTKLNAAGTALVYSTYIGGSLNEGGNGIAVDPSGAAYVVGSTTSLDFPTTANAYQPEIGGDIGITDAYVVKLSPAGSAIVYASYLGGSGTDGADAVAVNAAGNAVVVGLTGSLDFPIANAVQASAGGSTVTGINDAFVVKLLPDGSDVVFATYLGGFDFDMARAVALDPAGNIYVGGTATSRDFPTTAGALKPAYGGGFQNGFVTKLDPNGNLLYSTFLGGNDGYDSVFGLAADAAGNVYAVGQLNSTDFPVVGGVNTMRTTGLPADAFVAKLNPSGSALLYSTILGGTGYDAATAVALGPGGGVWVGGDTLSSDFPVTLSANNSASAGFLLRLTPTTGVTFSQYIGPSPLFVETDVAGVATDAGGNVYVAGSSDGEVVATSGAFQSMYFGGSEGFAQKLLALPDLTASAAVPAGTVLSPGRTLPVTVRTLNVGDAPAGASTTRLYLLDTSTMTRLLRGQTAVGALAAGANSSTSLTVTIPKTQPAGSFVFQACADDVRQVTEETDTNNCGNSAILRLARADLVVTSVSVAGGSVARGARANVTATVRNQGDLAAPATQARIFLAQTSSRARTDTAFATLMNFGALNPGQNASVTTSITIPASQPVGPYFVIVCADDRGGVVESNEANNCAASASGLGVTAPASVRIRR